MLSKNQFLSIDAFAVLKTNKYFDFKDRDTMVLYVDDKVYERISLNNYFGYRKDWAAIEKETSDDYNGRLKNATYTPWNDGLKEEYTTGNGYLGISKKYLNIYEPNGFLVKSEKTTYVDTTKVDYEGTKYIFDYYKVTKIINRTQHRKEPEERKVITASYGQDWIEVNSENGTIVCKFIKDPNSVVYISTLSPRATCDAFIYASLNTDIDEASYHCTKNLAKKLSLMPMAKDRLISARFVSGSGTFGDTVKIEDVWEMEFSTSPKQDYTVSFLVVKQPNGWKIDEYSVLPLKSKD